MPHNYMYRQALFYCMEHIETVCPSCSPDTPVIHIVLKGTEDVLLQCEECRSVHKEKKPVRIPVRVIISKSDKSLHAKAMLTGVITKGDELIIDNEETGEAALVQVTSIEVGDKRMDSAKAQEIRTIWARGIEEVIVKIAVSHRETTESITMRVPGDREFVIGEKIEVNNRKLKIIRIKLRDSGFKSRKGVSIKAKDITRVYAESRIKEPERLSRRRGERIVIKKRESVWSLRKSETD